MRGWHAVQLAEVNGAGEGVLDRDVLSDLVQAHGLSRAMREVGRCRAETLTLLNRLFRRIAIEGEAADPADTGALIDRLRSIGAASAVAEARRVLLEAEPGAQREGLYAVIATAVLACDNACGYLSLLKAGLDDLAALGCGECPTGFIDETRGYLVH